LGKKIKALGKNICSIKEKTGFDNQENGILKNEKIIALIQSSLAACMSKKKIPP